MDFLEKSLNKFSAKIYYIYVEAPETGEVGVTATYAVGMYRAVAEKIFELGHGVEDQPCVGHRD